MSKSAGDLPELVLAAQALEDNLRTLEELSRSVQKIRLHNEKSVARAARELNEALALPGRLADSLKLLAGAMTGMQERQQAALEPLAARAHEIQSRAEKLGQFMQRFAALGAEAHEVTELLQSAAKEDDRSAALGEVEARLTQLTEGARGLAEDARADDWPDFAGNVDALKQSIGSLRGRLKMDAHRAPKS